MAKAKAEFKWDSEKRIGAFGSHDRRSEVFLCELNGKQYVQCTKEVKTKKNEWKRTRGTTMLVEDFKQLLEVFGDYELHNAFEGQKGGTNITTKRNTPRNTPALKGIKGGAKEAWKVKLETLRNYDKLNEARRNALLTTIEAELEEWGTVGVIISASSFKVRGGDASEAAEKYLRAQRGFKTAEYVYLSK